MVIFLLGIFSSLLMFICYVLNKPVYTLIVLVFFCIVYLRYVYRNEGLKVINPISMYAVAGIVMAISNIIGINAADTPQRDVYFIYAVEENINLAMLIATVGVVFVVVGYELNIRRVGQVPALRLWKISSIVNSQRGVRILLFISFLIIVLRIYNRIPRVFGTIEGFLLMAPIATIFFLSRYAVVAKDKYYSRWALVLLLVETVRALLFDYLRLHFILPSVAFLLGYMLDDPRIDRIINFRLVPVYVVIVLFVTFFTFFGSNRAYLSQGTSRFSELQNISEEEGIEDENTLFMRFSNFNQLTNVVELVQDDGFYKGETLRYLGFAFIPRFLWPEKPLIQMGAWFAYKIGRGYIDENGRYRNAINMTVSGEFYLNYGWPGLILGSMLFGFIISLFWSSINIWDEKRNILATMFGFYLLFLGLFSFGANISIMVTITAMYLITLAISYISKFFTSVSDDI